MKPTFWNTDKIVSISAIFISALTLYVTFEQFKISRAQQRLSVLPYLSMGNYNTGGPNYKLVVKNDGIGPAFIESVTMIYKGKKFETDLINFLHEQFPAELDSIPNLTHSNIYQGLLIPAGQTIEHLAIDNSQTSADKLLRLFGKLDAEGIEFEIVYSSIYKEKWKLRAGDASPAKVED